MPRYVRFFLFCLAAAAILAPSTSCDEKEREVVFEYDTIFNGTTTVPGLAVDEHNVLMTSVHHFSVKSPGNAQIKISATVLTAEPHDRMDFFIVSEQAYEWFLIGDTAFVKRFYTNNVTHVMGFAEIAPDDLGRFYILMSNRRDSTAKQVRATIVVRHDTYKD